MNVAPAAHACGEQATGYGTGIGAESRSKPQNSSGRRNVREVLGGLEDVADEPVRLVLEPVALQAGRDERRVVRPDGPGVVADRVVAGLVGGVRPDPPAARTAPARAAGRRRRGRGPARRSRSTGTGRRSSRSRRPGASRRRGPSRSSAGPRPRTRPRSGRAARRRRDRAGRRARSSPRIRGEPRHPALGVVDVALDLGEGDRRLAPRGRPVADRVARVLPALVEQAARRAALVLDEAVAVAVARTRRSSRARPARSARGGRRAPGRRSSRTSRRAGSARAASNRPLP